MRNEAFKRALAAVIKPGETTVADIGAGTGLLALMAAKLGAREVFLYEAAEVAGVAAKVLKANRARNCHLLPCHSTEMVDPPKVDLVVSETLGNYPFEENIIETLNDARRRFLKPGGSLIPRRLEQLVSTRRDGSHPSRAQRVGRGRLRSVGRQGDEPQQHLRAHVCAQGSAGGRCARARVGRNRLCQREPGGPQGRGRAGGLRLPPPSTVLPRGGGQSWRRTSRCRRRRARRARTGSSSIFHCWSRSRPRPARRWGSRCARVPRLTPARTSPGRPRTPTARGARSHAKP